MIVQNEMHWPCVINATFMWNVWCISGMSEPAARSKGLIIWWRRRQSLSWSLVCYRHQWLKWPTNLGFEPLIFGWSILNCCQLSSSMFINLLHGTLFLTDLKRCVRPIVLRDLKAKMITKDLTLSDQSMPVRLCAVPIPEPVICLSTQLVLTAVDKDSCFHGIANVSSPEQVTSTSLLWWLP